MNQFGLGVPKNTVRAERYYQYALQADSKMDGSSTQQQGDKDMIGGAAGSNSHVDMDKNTDALEVLPAQLKMMVRSLLWMCSPATRLACSVVSLAKYVYMLANIIKSGLLGCISFSTLSPSAWNMQCSYCGVLSEDKVAVNNKNFLRPDISDSCVTSLVRVLFLVFSYIILESECKLEERIFFNRVLCAVQNASHHGGISLNQLCTHSLDV
jgi:hypothetical protein